MVWQLTMTSSDIGKFTPYNKHVILVTKVGQKKWPAHNVLFRKIVLKILLYLKCSTTWNFISPLICVYKIHVWCNENNDVTHCHFFEGIYHWFIEDYASAKKRFYCKGPEKHQSNTKKLSMINVYRVATEFCEWLLWFLH